MRDPIQFKIKTAQKYLSKIPDKTPKTVRQQEKLEENTQAFLFFASGVIEIVKRQINDKFEIFDKENVFYIYGLQKNLQSFGAQKKVKDQILNYFSIPTTPKINTVKSSLWKLQALRNQAMHGNIVKISGQYIEFSYSIHGKDHVRFTQRAKNPHAYFAQILKNLKKFTTHTLQFLE